jgi:hypothetical protein
VTGAGGENDMAQPELWQSELTNLLGRLETLITESRKVPWTGYALVETEPVMALLDHMRRVMPEDIRRARWIVEEQERLLGDAQRMAAETLAGAQERVNRLAGEAEITREAEARARQILAQAEETSRDMRQAARAYVDDLLAGVERHLTETVARIRANREELRG